MKKCPYCAEEIQDEAIKCKHCGEILSGPLKKKPVPKLSSGCAAGCLIFVLAAFGFMCVIGSNVPTPPLVQPVIYSPSPDQRPEPTQSLPEVGEAQPPKQEEPKPKQYAVIYADGPAPFLPKPGMPYQESDIIMRIPPNQKVEVIGTRTTSIHAGSRQIEQGWYHVKYKGTDGWIGDWLAKAPPQ